MAEIKNPRTGSGAGAENPETIHSLVGRRTLAYEHTKHEHAENSSNRAGGPDDLRSGARTPSVRRTNARRACRWDDRGAQGASLCGVHRVARVPRCPKGVKQR